MKETGDAGTCEPGEVYTKQYTIQNAHKWNDIKLEDVDSILDCDRLDIFYNLYSLVSPERINLII